MFSKKYFQDKLVLSLVSIEVFLMLLNTALILLRIGNQQASGGYFMQYRSNLGIGAFKTGGILDVLEFILFGILVVVIHTSLSIRIYDVRRQVAIGILSLGMFLLIVSMIVSNALLVLR
ncbi:MAG TPA: hypothetical protein VMR95_04230 [Candidatus Binatia bacterium]|nr:hypothetical protein [Candidatus Binatia bacterium]